ncbi:MAG: quinone-dependent dihydroorotate dehydrogenase [Cyclobacteriaceae bacterium]|nr:quinone-dependent dihydroorotate dehydrogenase [Cyclobacteriaceae bacterium]
MYKIFIRPFLFFMNPERVHKGVMGLLKWSFKIPGIKFIVTNLYSYPDKGLHTRVMGLNFDNPVGLAAGFDKDAEHVDELDALGFGFLEIGTLTPLPQPGNPRPRLFRLPKDRALINRMGFNNKGAQNAVSRLNKRKSKIIIGGNIGKNKVTDNLSAHEDYLKCLETLYDSVDYFVVNISSPNTPGLRELQEKEPLTFLLKTLKKKIDSKKTKKPLLLKIAPDLEYSQLDDIIEIVKEVNIEGVIATNTTISRNGLLSSNKILDSIGQGGLSGKPLKDRSTEIIRYLSTHLGPDFTIIGVGGIFSPEDALEKIKAGASLIQLYTGFIYEGPGIIKKINKALLREFKQ